MNKREAEIIVNDLNVWGIRKFLQRLLDQLNDNYPELEWYLEKDELKINFQERSNHEPK